MKLTATSRLALLGLVLAGLTSLAAAADRPAQPANTVEPKYPYLMRRAEATAEVTVAFKIDAKGKVTDARVIDSNNPDFIATTLDAARQWTFKPAIKDGKPVESRVLQTFVFSFREQPQIDKVSPVYVAGQSEAKRPSR